VRRSGNDDSDDDGIDKQGNVTMSLFQTLTFDEFFKNIYFSSLQVAMLNPG
jgi:hypothetical protein